jgi:hypothetical protein
MAVFDEKLEILIGCFMPKKTAKSTTDIFVSIIYSLNDD